jgi:hypothetical protein
VASAVAPRSRVTVRNVKDVHGTFLTLRPPIRDEQPKITS